MLPAKMIPDTFYTVEEELLLFGGSVLLGIPAGILCDVFRFLRRLIRHHWSVTMIEDIFSLVAASYLLLCYVSGFAGGKFRIYYIIGCLCGFLLHECTLSSLCFRLWDSLVCIAAKIPDIFVKNDKK